ncbi:hypothetical protein, partial [Escherichia coli]|uniref:hypothetical protein n=1 Tax=Escherichia coli TaxID=562 RepID=UPI0010CC6D9E
MGSERRGVRMERKRKESEKGEEKVRGKKRKGERERKERRGGRSEEKKGGARLRVICTSISCGSSGAMR